MTSRDQVQRMLTEVPYLQAHPGVSISEVAATFGISKKQVQQDLDVLWMCGLPGALPDDLIDIDMDAAKGDGSIRLSNADYLDRPMRFTPDEAMSLIVALRNVADLATGEVAQAALRAANKLSTVIPAARIDQVDVMLSSGSAHVRDVINEAIETSRRLVLEYDNASRGVTTHPVVDPAQIRTRDGVVYLDAWSVERNDWRTFRLDRVASAKFSGEAAAEHGVPRIDEKWFESSQEEVTLDLAPDARWVGEYYPIISAEDLPDDVLRVRFPVGDPGWIRALILRLGTSILRVEPPQAASDAGKLAAQALELYK